MLFANPNDMACESRSAPVASVAVPEPASRTLVIAGVAVAAVFKLISQNAATEGNKPFVTTAVITIP